MFYIDLNLDLNRVKIVVDTDIYIDIIRKITVHILSNIRK